MLKFKGTEYLTLVLLAAGAFAATYFVTRAARHETARPSEPEARRVEPPVQKPAVPTAPPVGPMKEPGATPPGMAWIPGGEFTMGTDDPQANPAEKPAHRVRVDGFWIDATEVTNAEFRRFVEATHYVTTAERPVDWEVLKTQVPPGTPKPPDDQLVSGSLVFTPPDRPVPLDDISQWWKWVPGANWRHPEGPGSSIEGKDDHPVVHVSWDDAAAYAKWAGKRLPTEAEWELAARGGLESKTFAWGNEFKPGGKSLANTWQGHFPESNTDADGFLRTSPVKSFPPNGFGLYDMIGNVWEWCADWYRPDAYALASHSGPGPAVNPTGPEQSYDPDEPFQPKRVTRGGSFLCSENYCSNYRPSARRGTATDSGMSHLGFRCVLTPLMRAGR
jgi:formylglycine-generating enzyme required for sulfatase activity